MFEKIGLSTSEEYETEPLCLAFANTRPSREREDQWGRELPEWAARVGGCQLEALDASQVVDARTLRDSIFRAMTAVARGFEVPEADRMHISVALSAAGATLFLNSTGETIEIFDVDTFRKFISLITLSATALLTGADRGRIRECASETCEWLFVDRSKNRSRRWCAMSDCGNRDKVRRYYARKRAT